MMKILPDFAAGIVVNKIDIGIAIERTLGAPKANSDELR